MTIKEWLLWEAGQARRRTIPPRGSQTWLAAKLGCEQSLVSKWVRRVSCPETYGTKIVRLSGGKVTLPELARVAP